MLVKESNHKHEVQEDIMFPICCQQNRDTQSRQRLTHPVPVTVAVVLQFLSSKLDRVLGHRWTGIEGVQGVTSRRAYHRR